jgi:hypothetical protein
VGVVFLVRAVHPSCHDRYAPQLKRMRAQTDPVFADQALTIRGKVECGRFPGAVLSYTLPLTPKPQLTETLRQAGWTRKNGLMTSPDRSTTVAYYPLTASGNSETVSLVAVDYAGSGSHLARNLLIGMSLLVAVMLLAWGAFRVSRRRSRRRSAARWRAS